MNKKERKLECMGGSRISGRGGGGGGGGGGRVQMCRVGEVALLILSHFS